MSIGIVLRTAPWLAFMTPLLAERVVHQLLLASRQIAQLVEFLHHLLGALLLGARFRRVVRLQTIHQLAKLRECPFGFLTRPLPGVLLEVLQHLIEILLPKLLHLIVLLLIAGGIFLLGVLLHLIEIVIEPLLQFGQSGLDLLVVGTLFERIGQPVLRVFQSPLGLG